MRTQGRAGATHSEYDDTSGAVRDPGYLLVPRWLVQGLALGFLVCLLVGAGGAWLLAPRWLPAIPALLDVDAPIAAPDVVVLKSAGESVEAEPVAARLLLDGRVGTIAVLGRPFAFDDLDPPDRSRRVDRLIALGVPRSAIVEIYRGKTLTEEMAALRTVARERNWRRILMLTDALGSRRSLLAARHMLGPDGITVGQRTFPAEWFDAETWWRDGRARGIVVVRLTQLLVALATRWT